MAKSQGSNCSGIPGLTAIRAHHLGLQLTGSTVSRSAARRQAEVAGGGGASGYGPVTLGISICLGATTLR